MLVLIAPRDCQANGAQALPASSRSPPTISAGAVKRRNSRAERLPYGHCARWHRNAVGLPRDNMATARPPEYPNPQP